LAVKAYDKASRAAKRTYWSYFTSSDGEAAKHLLMTHFPGFQPIEKHQSYKNVAACLAYGYIPIAWRVVRVILILKPGRGSYKLAKSLNLKSFFLKTMERLVDSYITAGPSKSFTLIESQYAYQRSPSTEAVLHDLVQKIDES
jgi:hypothetical protein